MKKIILLSACIFFAGMSAAQVNGTLSYQGYLTDDNGEPVNDGVPHEFLFTFYDGLGATVATRGPISTDVIKGLFTVVIGKDATGANSPLPLDIWNEDITVGITVDGGTELDPIPLTSVPYAFQSQVANSVDGANIAGTVDAALLSGTVDNLRLDPELQDLADGELTGSLVGTGIDATNITSGTLSGALLDAVDATILTGTVDNLRLDAELQDLADGELTGSLVGTGVDATNITSGTLSGALLDAVDAAILTGTVDNLRLDADVQDLADGELTGSKIGTGIDATNITTGVLSGALLDATDAAILTGTVSNSLLDADLQDLADGTLSGSAVGAGIDASNITVGILPNTQLDADVQDLADGTLSGTKVGTGISATNITTGVLNGTLLDAVDGSILTGTIANGSLDTDLQDLADGSLSGSKVGAGIAGANIDDSSITSAKISGTIAISDGGTNATTAAFARANLGLDIGADVQAFDAGLTSIAGLTTAADRMIYTTSSDTYAAASLTTFGRSLIDDANESTFKATVNLEPGTDIHAYNADLADLADGSLSGSKVGTGISASNVTTGTLPNTVLDADLQDLADGTLSDARLESTVDITALNVASGEVSVTSTGYTQLGSSGVSISGSSPTGASISYPSVKLIHIEGTTAIANGLSSVTISGLDDSKIIAINVIVEYSTGNYVESNSTASGLQFYTLYIGDVLYVQNVSGASTGIASRPFKATIIYTN